MYGVHKKERKHNVSPEKETVEKILFSFSSFL